MKNLFSISEAAKMADMTSETLRHYDRIGLVRPREKDAWTGYRYYSEQEIVRLNTIQALRYMDLSLKEIKEVLEYDDLEKIVTFLKRAEQSADAKIAKLRHAKRKIELARKDYEKKWNRTQQTGNIFVQPFPKRVILLSDTMSSPTLDHLWNYLSHFYAQVGESRREEYEFEDMAGVYTREGESRLFAVCIRYPGTEDLTVLPAGNYLCANTAEDGRERTLEELIRIAGEEYGVTPEFTVQMVVVTGILQWSYQIQLWIGGGSLKGRPHQKEA